MHLRDEGDVRVGLILRLKKEGKKPGQKMSVEALEEPGRARVGKELWDGEEGEEEEWFCCWPEVHPIHSRSYLECDRNQPDLPVFQQGKSLC